MLREINKYLNKDFPQNYIIRNPLPGALIVAIFCFAFLLMYQPLGTHAGWFLSYEATMAVYCLVAAAAIFISAKFIKNIGYFSNTEDWTIFKEFATIIISLFVMGVFGYFAGFLIEEPAARWNFATFFDSLKNAFLIGIIPFLFFTSVNMRFWFLGDNIVQKGSESYKTINPNEDLIKISSKLKKEELNFYPGQFICAESEGNYVVFHLYRNEQLQKVVIRNSINNVERQLSKISYIMRTHRAFIVNLKKIISRKGNTLGYRLKLSGVDDEIPVARNKTKEFNRLLKQL